MFGRMQRLFLIALICTLSACAGSARSVHISESELQSRITKELLIPMTLLQIFDVQLSNPVVKLDAGSERLNAQLDTRINSPLNAEPVVGKIDISGKLRFDAQSNTVMLAESRIEHIDIKGMGIDDKYSQLFNLLAARLGGELLDNVPLYTLKPDELKVGNRRYAPSDFKIVGRDLKITLQPQ
jgi:hypothetical protein